jgi:hypothetical protein
VCLRWINIYGRGEKKGKKRKKAILKLLRYTIICIHQEKGRKLVKKMSNKNYEVSVPIKQPTNINVLPLHSSTFILNFTIPRNSKLLTNQMVSNTVIVTVNNVVMAIK